MASQDILIETLTEQLEKLNNITKDAGYDSDFSIELFFDEQKRARGEQKLTRWVEDSVEIIKPNIGSEEGRKLQNCLKSKDVKTKMSNCTAYLNVLIDDIKDNPEKYKSISKKCYDDDFVLAILNNMHPEVIKIAKDRIQSDSYRSIISDVCISLESYIKKRINSSKIMNLGGTTLMEHVFSKDKFIIKLSNEEEERKGFMFLFSGAIKAIRNQCSHKVYSMDLQEALEILGFLSLLFRTVDKGKVQK